MMKWTIIAINSIA